MSKHDLANLGEKIGGPLNNKRSAESRQSFLVGPVAKALARPGNYLRMLRDPAWPFRMAWTRYRLTRAGRSQIAFVADLIPKAGESLVQATLAETRANRPLLDHVEERMSAVMELTEGRLPGWIPMAQAEILDALVRLTRPSLVVETGVGHGMSTTFMLQGLEDNGAGDLYSIDLPLKMRVADHPPGCIVPDHLRHRWNLILGDSRSELPQLLSKI